MTNTSKFWTGFWVIVVLIGLSGAFLKAPPSKSTAAQTTPTAQPAVTQADKDKCQIQAQEYAYAQAQAVIDAADAQTRANGGHVVSEGDPTKVGIYQPDMQNYYLNCIDGTNY